MSPVRHLRVNVDRSTNHKPEIAVCLSDRFLGFAGLRPFPESIALLSISEVEQLPTDVRRVVEKYIGAVQPNKEDLRDVFEQFISMEGDDVSQVVNNFVERVKKDGVKAFDGVGGDISQKDKEHMVEATKVLDEYNHGDGAIFASL